jgi:hypothetical protein
MARMRKYDTDLETALDADDTAVSDESDDASETLMLDNDDADDAIIDDEPQPPTLDDAFWILAEALLAKLEDNQPEAHHCRQVMMWYTDGNCGIAWAHLVAILEGVLGVRLSKP